MRGARIGAALAVVGLPVAADLGLTDAERLAFRAEVRAAILADPDIAARVADLLDPVVADVVDDLYGAAIADDLALIDRHRAAIFGDAGLALFAAPDDAYADAVLETLARTRPDLTVRRHDVTAQTLATGGDPSADLARTLGFDILPFWVTPRAFIRGDVPAVLIDRALDR